MWKEMRLRFAIALAYAPQRIFDAKIGALAKKH
jgi:hypothetical protein